jgi:purine-nucleoside phosphorylase
MTTPHISAKPGDFADTVLMPGDPLRAKYIADNFLSEVKQVNAVRNMLGFTGSYKGKPVSVMGSGMGVPSISIYSYELYKFFGVKNIIRVGSCGAIQPDVNLRDVVIAIGATTDSNVNKTRLKGYEFAATASYDLLESAVKAARAHKATVHVGNVFTADLFYDPDKEVLNVMAQYGVLAVEMEAAGLYGVAAECGAKALAICTVSDHILTGEQTSSDERQNSFNDMIEITLNSL